MDDCSSDVKEIAFSFAQSLSDIAMECEGRSRSNISILVPLRYYTNIGTDTEGYPKIDIPIHSVSDIMVVKIEHVKDLIDSNHKSNIREFIPSSTFREKQVRLKDGSFKKVYERFHSGRWVLVENISTLLKAFAKKSISKNPTPEGPALETPGRGYNALTPEGPRLSCP